MKTVHDLRLERGWRCVPLPAHMDGVTQAACNCLSTTAITACNIKNDPAYREKAADIIQEAIRQASRAQARQRPSSLVSSSVTYADTVATPYALTGEKALVIQQASHNDQPADNSSTTRSLIAVPTVESLNIQRLEELTKQLTAKCGWMAPAVISAMKTTYQLHSELLSSYKILKQQLANAQDESKSEQNSEKLAITMKCKATVRSMTAAMTNALSMLDADVLNLTISAQDLVRGVLEEVCLDEKQVEIVSNGASLL